MNPAEIRAPSDDEERVLARLAVKGEVVSAERMAEVLSLQQEERSHGRTASLEEILLRSALVTEKQLDSLRSAGTFLLKREQERVYCRILVKAGYADQEQIDLALMDQQRLFKESTSSNRSWSYCWKRGPYRPGSGMPCLPLPKSSGKTGRRMFLWFAVRWKNRSAWSERKRCDSLRKAASAVRSQNSCVRIPARRSSKRSSLT